MLMFTSRSHLPSPSSPLTPPPSSPLRRIAVARARLQYHKQSVYAPPMGATSHHPPHPHLRRHRWQRSMSQDSSFSDMRRKVSPFNYSCYYSVLRVHSPRHHQLGVLPQQGVTHCLLKEAVPFLSWQRLRNNHLKPHLLLMRRRG